MVWASGTSIVKQLYPQYFYIIYLPTVYEAGKGIKTALSTPVAVYPPYYVQGMPTMVPISPPSLIEPKMSTAPSIDNNISSAQQSLGKYSTHFAQKKIQFFEFHT